MPECFYRVTTRLILKRFPLKTCGNDSLTTHKFEMINPKTGTEVEISIPDEDWEDEALAG